MKHQILIVEDSATQAEALRALLEEEYTVTVARSGEEALERIVGSEFDLILSDIMMPGISGYELCRHIKENPEWRGTPVVLLTSLTDPMDIVRGLEAGADNYITKPYEPEHLLARLSHVLGNRRLRRTAKTSMGVSVNFLGTELMITSDKEQILDLLLSSVEDVIRTNRALEESRRELAEAHAQLEAYAKEKAREAQVSSERYRTLMQNAGDAIFVLDTHGRIAEANTRGTEILGRPLREVIGQPLETFVIAEQRNAIRESLAEAIQVGYLETVERSLERADGSVVLCEASASLAPVGDEELVIAIYRDITERKRSEQALKEREESFRSLFHNIPELLYILDFSGRFLKVNDAVIDAYGYSREELLGQTPAILADPERVDMEETAARLQRAAAGEPQRFEWWARRKDGTTFLKEVLLSKTVYFGQEVVIAIGRDITERKRAEEELRQRESQLREAQSIARLGSWEHDVATGRLHWSEQVSRIFGCSPTQPVETFEEYLSMVGPDDREQVAQVTSTAVDQRKPFEVEYRITRADGIPRVVYSRGKPETDEDGNVVRLVGTVQDITEQRALETQLQQAQKMEAIGRLAGGVAHDFNNVLLAIKGNLHFLREDIGEDHPSQDDVQEIGKAADRAAALTRQLLAFSRQQVLQPHVIALGKLIREHEQMLRRLVPEDIEIQTSIAPDLWPVEADPGQVEQVLMNLVVNARDAMPKGGTIQIRGENAVLEERDREQLPYIVPGSYVRLSVADTGHGMDPTTLERIYEPFFTTKEQGKGTGLGLSTAYGIIKQSGGYIWATSEVGEGTTFEVYLPRADTPEEELPTERAPVAPSQVPRTVLLVEDGPQVRRSLARTLQRQGHMVLEAESGPEAIQVFEANRDIIELVITDVVMPKMSGVELAERLFSAEPDLPVLFMSGYLDDEIERRGLSRAGVHFIEKPFGYDNLARKVNKIFNAAE